MEKDLLLRYYAQQAGSGIGPIYSGPLYQSGHGIGSFLAKIYRTVSPYLKSGAKKIGREVLRTGTDIINDIDNEIPIKDALKTRSKEAFNRITGGTYKQSNFGQIPQTDSNRRRVRKQSIQKIITKIEKERLKKQKKRINKNRKKSAKKAKKSKNSGKKIKKQRRADIFD